MVYGVKPDLADLCTFSALCAIVEWGAKLKKLELSACSWGTSMEGGGYRVWDLHKSVVVELRGVMFFEEGLPLPTYHELAMQAMNANEPLVQQPQYCS